MRRPRRLVLSAAAMGLALAVSGCTYFNPVQTHEFYQSGDGTNGNLEQAGTMFAGVRNAIVLVGEDGAPEFSTTVVNYSDEELSVELEGLAKGSTVFSTSVAVPAQKTVELGSGGDQQLVSIGELPVDPGDLIDLTVTAGDQSTTITVPVIEVTSLSHYGDEEPAAG